MKCARDVGRTARKADSEGRAALELLARRGYGPDERKRLRALVASAQSVPNLVNIDNEATERAERARVDALKRLRAWYEEWSEVARATVRRRDHLIRLGLATRRRGNAEEDEGAPEGDVLDATED